MKFPYLPTCRPVVGAKMMRQVAMLVAAASAVSALLFAFGSVDRPVARPSQHNDLTPATGCIALWSTPVTAPVVDGYRPPSSPYGPGNRGLEYGTASGDPVSVVDDGVVRFSGQVGSSRFVTVEHRTGLVSTYGFVEQTLVSAGEGVTRGQTIAVAAPGFHLTARVAGRYRDPTPLMQTTCYSVRLVPLPPGFSAS